MNGFQFARALRQEADFAELPVILMSAKSDRIREQFVEQTGSFDAIAKPFDADALLTLVENAFRRKNERPPNDRPTAPRLPDTGTDEDDVIVLDSLPLEEAPTFDTHDGTGDATIMRAASPVAILASQLREILAPFLPQIAEPDVARKVELALTKDVVRDLARVATELSRTEPIVLAGDLGVLPIGGILQLLQAENQTGKLVATSPRGEITVMFRGGLIDLVQSKGAGDEFRLGRYFVEAGVVKADDIEALARGDRPTPVSTKAGPAIEPPEDDADVTTSGPASSVFKTSDRVRAIAEEVEDEDDDAEDDDDAADDDVEDDNEQALASPAPVVSEEDELNMTRIGASAFKREVEMPNESAPAIVGDDELEVIDNPKNDENDATKDGDEEVLSMRDLLAADSVPPSEESSPTMANGSVHGAASAASNGALTPHVPVAAVNATSATSATSATIASATSATSAAVPIVRPVPAPTVTTRLLLGDALVQAARITPDQLREGLVRQSSELVYELLRWQKGRFELFRTPPADLAEKTKLGLPVAQVVMEGFRRVEEWRALEASVGSFESVVIRDDVVARTMKDDVITRSERRVLDAVDGERTVREVIVATHLSSFDVCRILAQFLEARIVRRRADENA